MAPNSKTTLRHCHSERREKSKVSYKSPASYKGDAVTLSVTEEGSRKTGTGEGWEEGLALILLQGK